MRRDLSTPLAPTFAEGGPGKRKRKKKKKIIGGGGKPIRKRKRCKGGVCRMK
jgi:hypothetical protein